MKKSVREYGVDCIHSVLVHEAFANIEINRLFSFIDEKRDRTFLMNLVAGTIRNLTPVDYQITLYLKKKIKNKDIYLKNILRCAVFEILFTSAKPYAVVNEYVSISKKNGNPGWGNLVNAVLRNILRNRLTLYWPDFEDEIREKCFFCTLPDWLGKMWEKQYGLDTALKLIESTNQPGALALRINTLKTDRKSFLTYLNSLGIPAIEGSLSKDAVLLSERSDLQRIPQGFHSSFTVQSEASQLSSIVLNPVANTLVLDMCAAPGGKTSHIAQLMDGKGMIYSSDVYSHKLDLIQSRMNLLEMQNFALYNRDGREWGKEFPDYFDYVMLDAPCSGLGVLNKRADSRLRKEYSDIEKLSVLQRELIDSAVRALKRGGRMVYSTCTLNDDENMKQYEYICKLPFMRPVSFDGLINNLDKEERLQCKDGYLELLPFKHSTDGFFISCFEKI